MPGWVVGVVLVLGGATLPVIGRVVWLETHGRLRSAQECEWRWKPLLLAGYGAEAGMFLWWAPGHWIAAVAFVFAATTFLLTALLVREPPPP